MPEPAAYSAKAATDEYISEPKRGAVKLSGHLAKKNLSVPPISFSREGVHADDPALDALFSPFDTGELSMPLGSDVLFLRARPGPWMHRNAVRDWICVQSFKPHAGGLLRHVGKVEPEIPESARHKLVLLLPTRQRDEARALFAQALDHVSDDGRIVVSIANNEGARSGQDDLERLVGAVQVTSKHKCRVFWSTSESQVDRTLQAQWKTFDAVQPIVDGWLSRPGLFAWNRIDPASALLASHLPDTLRGAVADLGAGFGYLAAQALQRNDAIMELDLYEAEARALDPARKNLRRVASECGRSNVTIDTIWHDVAEGLPKKYNAIISNPPFHQGRADLPGLGQRFIEVAADALNDDGELWLVANRHLPYESTLNARFLHVRSVAQGNGFKVLHAREPRR